MSSRPDKIVRHVLRCAAPGRIVRPGGALRLVRAMPGNRTESAARQLSGQVDRSPYDLAGALSGYGGGCPDGVPVEFGLLTILAAFGASFGILYRALTLTLGGRKRKRRDTIDLDAAGVCDAATISGHFGCNLQRFMESGADEEKSSSWFHVADLLWHGE